MLQAEKAHLYLPFGGRRSGAWETGIQWESNGSGAGQAVEMRQEEG